MRRVRLSILILIPLVGCDAKNDAAPAKAEPAKAEPAKAEPAKAEPPKPEKFGAEFCETIIPCFEKHEFSGSFSADVTVDIEPDGKVASVSFTGDAPKPVQDCIVASIEPIQLSAYNGKPGRTRCTQNGQLSGGTRMVMADYGYEVREAGDAKADEKADDADAKADEKADDADEKADEKAP